MFGPHAVRRIHVEQDGLRDELQRLTGVVSALEQKVEALSVSKGRYEERKRPDRAPQTTKRPVADGAQRKPVICFRCKQPGHLARGCANFE